MPIVIDNPQVENELRDFARAQGADPQAALAALLSQARQQQQRRDAIDKALEQLQRIVRADTPLLPDQAITREALYEDRP